MWKLDMWKLDMWKLDMWKLDMWKLDMWKLDLWKKVRSRRESDPDLTVRARPYRQLARTRLSVLNRPLGMFTSGSLPPSDFRAFRPVFTLRSGCAG
jgi:hypothetical protein